MSLQKLMINYAQFNLWANKAFADWLKTKPTDILNREVHSSFPSIIKTIVHIWDTERFWLSVLKTLPPPVSFRYKPFEGTDEEGFNGFLHQSEELANYVTLLTEFDLLEECVLDTSWEKERLPKYEFIHHCLNHSTYHRGQIITIGHNTGITDAPITDYHHYNMRIKNVHPQ
jgi:uncharacterized damage-inducible protein DinB